MPAKPPADKEAEAEESKRFLEAAHILEAANILEDSDETHEHPHQNFDCIAGSNEKDFAASVRKRYHVSGHSKTNSPGRNRHDQTTATDDVAAQPHFEIAAADAHPQSYRRKHQTKEEDPSAVAATAAVKAEAVPLVQTALDTSMAVKVEAKGAIQLKTVADYSESE